VTKEKVRKDTFATGRCSLKIKDLVLKLQETVTCCYIKPWMELNSRFGRKILHLETIILTIKSLCLVFSLMHSTTILSKIYLAQTAG